MELTVWVWLILLAVFLAVEALTVTTVSLWFAGGALAALIAAMLRAELWLQVTLFLAVSAILLACLRPLVRKHFTPGIHSTNVDAVVGTRGYVTASVDNMAATGTVKLGGMDWTARSADGAPIPAGTLVEVCRIEGVKAIVRAVEIPAEV